MGRAECVDAASIRRRPRVPVGWRRALDDGSRPTQILQNADESIKKISDYVYDEDCANSGLAKFFNEFFDLKIEE